MSSPDLPNPSEQSQKTQLSRIERDLLGTTQIGYIGDHPHHSSLYLVIAGDEKSAVPYDVSKLDRTQGSKLVGKNKTPKPEIDSMGILALNVNEMVVISFSDPNSPHGWNPLLHLTRDSESTYRLSIFDGAEYHTVEPRQTVIIGSFPDKNLFPNAITFTTPKIDTISKTQFGIRQFSSSDGKVGIFLDNLGRNPVQISPAIPLAAA